MWSQVGVDEEDQAAPNTGDAGEDEHKVGQDDQSTEVLSEQAAGETYGVCPSAGNADEYGMHALVGYEPPIDRGIPLS